MADPKQDIEKLLHDAKLLRDRVAYKATEKVSAIQNAAEGLSLFGKFIHSLYRIFGPVFAFFRPVFLWTASRYMRFWKRFAYRKGEFSKRRAALVSTFTFLFIMMFTPTWIGSAIRFFTMEPLIDGLLMATTLKTERFYLNSTEELDPEANVHSVRGCRHIGECHEQDAIYFRVKPRLSHDIWKFIVYGNPIYVPDHVVGTIVPMVNKCEVTYYGYRLTSSWIAKLLRTFQVYPTMLEANCIVVYDNKEPAENASAVAPALL